MCVCMCVVYKCMGSYICLCMYLILLLDCKDTFDKYADLYIYIYVRKKTKDIFLFSATSSNIHHYFNNSFDEFKVLKKLIITEMFNINFHSKFIKFGLFCFFLHLFIYVRKTKHDIYLYLYIYTYHGLFFLAEMNRSTSLNKSQA